MYKRYFIHSALFLVALIAPAFVNPTAQVHAQIACASELAGADEAYTFGRFDEAIDLLEQCLRKRDASSLERQRAYRLLALSYIGKDDDRRARDNVRELLQLNPDYSTDPDQDPPPFAEMIREVKREMAQAPIPAQPGEESGGKRGVSKLLLIGGGVVLAGVAAAVLLSGGGGNGDGGGNGEPPQPTTLNEVEPNDSPAQAQLLRGTPPITVRGSAEIGDGSGIGRLDEFGNVIDVFEDFYQVTTTQAGIRITLGGLASDGDIYLADLDGFILGQSINAGTSSETINFPNQATGTYLIAVSISDDAQGQGLPTSTAYTLVVDAAVSGASLRVAMEQIQQFGGATLTGTVRLMAHAGAGDVTLQAVVPPSVASWTAYRSSEDGLVEHDGTEAFHLRPGRGFWIQSDQPFDMMPATSADPVAPGETYALPLEKGWNIIANPFTTRLDWAAVQAANGVTQTLWRWDGHFAPSRDFTSAQKGEAFYFMNAAGLDHLKIPLPNTRLTIPPEPSTTALTLSVYREGRLASAVRAGFAHEAAQGFDRLDQVAPPGYFEAASLRLMRPLSSTQSLALAGEFKPWPEDRQQFDLVLVAPAHAPVELRIEGLEAFAGYEVVLVDLEKSVVYDVSARPSIMVTPGQAQSRLRLLIGSQAFIQAIRDEFAPEALSISNYPNPFNPTTQISYTLPASAAHEPVRLEVFDVAGRLVRVLVEGLQEPGVHQVMWDGTDAAGIPVSSGVYLSRLHAGRHMQINRMLLLK